MSGTAPDPSADLDTAYRQLLQQAMAPAVAQTPQAPTPSSHEGRGFLSLLGEALGGGQEYGTTAERESGGLRALGAMGARMLAASDYSYQPHTLGSIIGQGMGAAGESLAGTQQVSAAQQAALLDYQKTQQEMSLARVKEALPILTQLQTLRQADAARRIALGGPASGTPGTTPGTSIAEVGRDPSAGTAGQQAFNPGNIMSTSAPGQTGVMTLPGDRKLAVFPNIETGVAATADNLSAYATQHGISTIHDAVVRWVGDPKADLTSYENDIAAKLGVKPTDKIDLTNPDVQRAFILAQQPHESGKPWLNPADVDKGIALAQARRKGGQPPTAPAVAGAPQMPPAAPGGPPGIAQAAAPAVPGGGGPLTPPGAPRPSPTGAIAQATRDAEVGPQPLPATAGKGTTLPAGNLQTTGKPPGVASNAEAIQAGVNLAQATPVVPGTGLAAGPPGIGQPAALASVVPGGGSSFAPTAPPAVAAPQAPPQAQQPPAAVPPAQTQPGPPAATPPAVTAPSVEPFVYNRGPLPPTIQSRLDNPGAFVSPDLTTALQVAAASGNIGEMAKAKAAVGAAADTVRAEAAKEAEAYHTNERNKQQEFRQKQIDAIQQNQQKQQEYENQIRLKQIEGEQTRLTNKEAVFNQANQKGLETAQTEQANARDVVAQLEGFRNISDNVGQPGWLQTTKFPGTDQSIAERLQQAGIKMDDTGGVQLLRGGITNLVKTLRAGMPMGSLSDRDLSFVERMGPTEWMDADTRSAAVGYLQQAYKAKMAFARDVQKEMSRGKNYGDAVDAADAKQKPFVPQVPADLTAHWSDNTPEWKDRRTQWAEQNDVRPGTLIHMGDGRIVVIKTPKRID